MVTQMSLAGFDVGLGALWDIDLCQKSPKENADLSHFGLILDQVLAATLALIHHF